MKKLVIVFAIMLIIGTTACGKEAIVPEKDIDLIESTEIDTVVEVKENTVEKEEKVKEELVKEEEPVKETKNELPENLVYLPEIMASTLPSIPIENLDPTNPIDGPDEEVEIIVTTRAPNKGLLSALASLDDEDFLGITKGRDGFSVGNYAVFAQGGKLVTVSADGEVGVLLESNRAIAKIAMKDRTTVNLAIVNLTTPHGQGYLCYEVNLETGKVALSPMGFGAEMMGIAFEMYNNHSYRVKYNFEADSPRIEWIGDSTNLAYGEEPPRLIENIDYYEFANNALYYTKGDANQIMRKDLKTLEESLYYTIPYPLVFKEGVNQRIELHIEHDAVIFFDGEMKSIINISTGEKQETNKKIEHITKDGFYSSSDAVLYYTTYDGKEKPILGNYSMVWIKTEHDETLYFEAAAVDDITEPGTQSTGVNTTAWSIKNDGTNLTRLDKLIHGELAPEN